MDDYWVSGLIFYKTKVPYFLGIDLAVQIFKIGKVIRLLKKIDINFVADINKKIELEEVINHENKLKF